MAPLLKAGGRRVEGQHTDLSRMVALLKDTLSKDNQLEYRARELVEGLAVALQAATLLRNGNTVVADLFCASRLGYGRSLCWTGQSSVDTQSPLCA